MSESVLRNALSTDGVLWLTKWMVIVARWCSFICRHCNGFEPLKFFGCVICGGAVMCLNVHSEYGSRNSGAMGILCSLCVGRFK